MSRARGISLLATPCFFCRRLWAGGRASLLSRRHFDQGLFLPGIGIHNLRGQPSVGAQLESTAPGDGAVFAGDKLSLRARSLARGVPVSRTAISRQPDEIGLIGKRLLDDRRPVESAEFRARVGEAHRLGVEMINDKDPVHGVVRVGVPQLLFQEVGPAVSPRSKPPLYKVMKYALA